MSSKAANDCLREGLFDSSKTSATKPSLRGALSSVLTSADSAFQLALEIALGGVSAKVQPLRLIQPCRAFHRLCLTGGRDRCQASSHGEHRCLSQARCSPHTI